MQKKTKSPIRNKSLSISQTASSQKSNNGESQQFKITVDPDEEILQESDLYHLISHKFQRPEANAPYLCKCQICSIIRSQKIDYLENPEDMSLADLETREACIQKNIMNEYDIDFPFILRRLNNSQNGTGQLRIPIPDTILFEDGEIRYSIQPKDNILNKIIKFKEPLNISDMRRTFIESFRNKITRDKEYRNKNYFGSENLKLGFSGNRVYKDKDNDSFLQSGRNSSRQSKRSVKNRVPSNMNLDPYGFGVGQGQSIMDMDMLVKEDVEDDNQSVDDEIRKRNYLGSKISLDNHTGKRDKRKTVGFQSMATPTVNPKQQKFDDNFEHGQGILQQMGQANSIKLNNNPPGQHLNPLGQTSEKNELQIQSSNNRQSTNFVTSAEGHGLTGGDGGETGMTYVNPNIMFCALIRYKRDTQRGDFQHTILSEKQFNKLAEKRKKDQAWKEILSLQQCLHNSKYKLDYFRIKFDIKLIDEDCVYFERSKIEPKILQEKIPRASTDYIPHTVEDLFQTSLIERDNKIYCYYILYKIYHFMIDFHKIKLNKFIAEFSYDVQGGLFLTNVIIIDVANEASGQNIKANDNAASLLKKAPPGASSGVMEKKLAFDEDAIRQSQVNTEGYDPHIDLAKFGFALGKKEIMNRMLDFENKKRMAKTLLYHCTDKSFTLYQKKLGEMIPEIFEGSPLTKIKQAMDNSRAKKPLSDFGAMNPKYKLGTHKIKSIKLSGLKGNIGIDSSVLETTDAGLSRKSRARGINKSFDLNKLREKTKCEFMSQMDTCRPTSQNNKPIGQDKLNSLARNAEITNISKNVTLKRNFVCNEIANNLHKQEMDKVDLSLDSLRLMNYHDVNGHQNKGKSYINTGKLIEELSCIEDKVVSLPKENTTPRVKAKSFFHIGRGKKKDDKIKRSKNPNSLYNLIYTNASHSIEINQNDLF